MVVLKEGRCVGLWDTLTVLLKQMYFVHISLYLITPLQKVPLVWPRLLVYRCENGVPERLSDLPKVVQLSADRMGPRRQVLSFCYTVLYYLLLHNVRLPHFSDVSIIKRNI